MTTSGIQVTQDWQKTRHHKTKIKLTEYKDGKPLKTIYVKS